MSSEVSSFCIFIGMSWNRGAISQQFKALCQELVSRGHQVVIIMDHRKTNYESPDTNPAYYTWPSKRPTGFRDAWFLQKLIWKYHPHCMISQFSSENLFLSIGWFNRTPCRVTWHHSIFEKAKDANLFKRILRSYLVSRKKIILCLASRVVGVSDAAGFDAHHVYGVPRKNLVTIHNSILDPLIDLPMDTNPDRNHITCTSALIEAKGQDTLLHAIPILCQRFPSVIFEFIGTGESLEKYMKLSQSLKIETQCQFSGLLPYEEVLKRMKHSWISIFPTRSEAFGLVALESLAVGTPVIASDTGGLPEIIQDGVEGFLVPVGDHKVLAEKISLLLSDEELRTRMSKNARKKYLSYFNLEETVKNNTTTIETIITEFLA